MAKHQKVLKLASNYISNKGKKLHSLFILCCLINIVLAQFGFEQWLHNDIQTYIPENKKHIFIYHNSNVGYISDNDSTQIYSYKSAIYFQKLFNHTQCSIEFFDIHEKFQAGYELLDLQYKKHSQNIKTSLQFEHFKNLIPYFEFTIHNDNNPSYHLGIEWNIGRNIDIALHNKHLNSNYDFLYKYDEFLFDVNGINKSSTTDSLKLGVRFSRFKLNIKKTNIRHSLNNKNIGQRILLPNHIDEKTIYDITYKLKYNQYLNISHQFKNKVLKLIFDDNESHFFTINKLNLDSKKIDINYIKRSQNYNLTIGLENLDINSMISARLRTSSVSESLEQSLGAPIINSLDTGLLNSKRIYIHYHRPYSWFIHFSYIYDKLNFNFRNTLLSVFGIPMDIKYEQLKYNRKEAIILGIGYIFNFKKNKIQFSFNQHIPLKLQRIENNIQNNDFLNFSSSQNKDYGGGEFKIKILRLI